jgi:hypothetical protein
MAWLADIITAQKLFLTGMYAQSFCREPKLGRMAIAVLSAIGVGLWYKEKNAEWAERAARPSRIDWVETGVVSPVVRNQKSCGKSTSF